MSHKHCDRDHDCDSNSGICGISPIIIIIVIAVIFCGNLGNSRNIC